jgi:hypothetical protein
VYSPFPLLQKAKKLFYALIPLDAGAAPPTGARPCIGPSSSRPEEFKGSSISLSGDLYPQKSVPKSAKSRCLASSRL